MSTGSKQTYVIRIRHENGDLSPLFEGLKIKHFGRSNAKPELNDITFTPPQLKTFIAFCIVRGRNDPIDTPADSYGFKITTERVTKEELDTVF